uniref:Candidate secreted effector n=2 Tax=Meloidogyne TaxID=189290 RepID=A0A914NI03_MELIC
MSRSRLSAMAIGVHFWSISGVLRLACFKNLKNRRLPFGIALDVLSFSACVDILRIRCFV